MPLTASLSQSRLSWLLRDRRTNFGTLLPDQSRENNLFRQSCMQQRRLSFRLEELKPSILQHLNWRMRIPLCLGQVPNITGALIDIHGGVYASAQGAFTFEKNGELESGILSGPWQYGVFKLNASSIASEYAGTKLQPKALTVLPCIRY